jgi:hypothetical protein
MSVWEMLMNKPHLQATQVAQSPAVTGSIVRNTHILRIWYFLLDEDEFLHKKVPQIVTPFYVNNYDFIKPSK